MIALIIIRAVAALLCLRRGFKRAAAFLVAGVLYELGRMPFQAWRSLYPKPYVGHGFLLWLPEPALMLLLPAVLLGAVSKWSTGLALWVVSFAFVAWSYPSLRGDNLIVFYEAVYLSWYLVGAGLIVARSIGRKLALEEGLLLLYALLGCAGVLLVVRFGPQNWISVRIPNGAALAASIGFCLFGPRQGSASPRSA